MKKFTRFLLVFFSLFIGLNFLLAFIILPFEKIFFDNFVFANISERILKNSKIEKKEYAKFHNEFTRLNFYNYDDYVGWKERPEINNSYKNIHDKFGRVAGKNQICKKNIYIYGSSTAFGYWVKDSQTIAFFLDSIIKEKKQNICVYNFGRANFDPYRENLLLIKNINEKKIKAGDIQVFINGSAVLLPSSLIDELEEFVMNSHSDQRTKFFYTAKLFFSNLPTTVIFTKIKRHLGFSKNENQEIGLLKKKEMIDNANEWFINNMKIRNALCKEFDVQCLTFLEPFGYSNTKMAKSKLLLSERGFFSADFISMYQLLKKIPNIIDISDIFKNINFNDAYQDDLHYSPEGSKLIAIEIFQKIKNKI